MKTSKIMCLALWNLTIGAQAQLTLEQGQSFVYAFGPSDLSLASTYLGHWDSTEKGVFTFMVADFQVGDQLSYEMFENDVSEIPICSGVMTQAIQPFCYVDSAWGDHQGAVRFTGLSGSVTLNVLWVSRHQANRTGGEPLFDVYASTLVPQKYLRIVREGTSVQITWSTNFADHVLESATSLPAAGWSTVTNAVATIGDHLSVTVGTDASTRFYRLRQPTPPPNKSLSEPVPPAPSPH